VLPSKVFPDFLYSVAALSGLLV